MLERRWITFEDLPDGTHVMRHRLISLESQSDCCACQMEWVDMLRATEVEWQRH